MIFTLEFYCDILRFRTQTLSCKRKDLNLLRTQSSRHGGQPGATNSASYKLGYCRAHGRQQVTFSYWLHFSALNMQSIESDCCLWNYGSKFKCLVKGAALSAWNLQPLASSSDSVKHSWIITQDSYRAECGHQIKNGQKCSLHSQTSSYETGCLKMFPTPNQSKKKR